MSGIQLTQSQRQTQILSHQMIQSVEILQMNGQELSDYIKELALENPMAEVRQTDLSNEDEMRLRKLEWLSSLDEQNRTFYRYDREDTEDNGLLNNVGGRRTESLGDVLRLQLLSGHYSAQEMEIFQYIIDSLDERGFFSLPAEHLAGVFHIPEEEALTYLEVMRDLEPYGVCARGPRECLLKQIDRKLELKKDPGESTPEDDEWLVEREVIDKYMDQLGKNRLPAIASALGKPVGRIVEALERIRELSPFPAQGFDSGEVLRYVTPDVTVVRFEDRFEILLNNYNYPELHVNQYYLQLMRSDCDKEVKDYLNDKFRQLEQTQGFIKKRSSTLLALAKCIVDRQRDFFLRGESALRPLRMRDAAQDMGVHESTVSRAVRDKYLQCSWGLYPLNYFFSAAIGTGEGEEQIATRTIKAALRKLIDEEDSRKPRSDQKLCDMLQEMGFPISRRTVAKYREEMEIGSTRERKSYRQQ